MPGRGPAPKLNAVDRKRGMKVRHEVVGGAGRPIPAGSWHPRAVAWWERMSRSAVAHLWREEDWDILERGLPLVGLFWTHCEAGESRDAVAVSNAIIRLETVLWLTPTDRARNGVKADPAPPVAPQSGARARLRLTGT